MCETYLHRSLPGPESSGYKPLSPNPRGYRVEPAEFYNRSCGRYFNASSLSPITLYLMHRRLHLGPYYSWLSPRHGWNDSEIPQCIHQARKHISKFVGGYCDKDPGDENNIDGALCEELSAGPRPSTSSHGTKEEGEKATENIRINHVVALAWTASGSRRVREVDDTPYLMFRLCSGS